MTPEEALARLKFRIPKFNGVRYHAANGKWGAYNRNGNGSGRWTFLGEFDTAGLAFSAYRAARAAHPRREKPETTAEVDRLLTASEAASLLRERLHLPEVEYRSLTPSSLDRTRLEWRAAFNYYNGYECRRRK
jgi:hypothetical protein